MIHFFTLILPNVTKITQEIEDSLFEAGCDDALLGSRDSVVYLDFDREANSLEEAIQSAKNDIQKAGFKVT